MSFFKLGAPTFDCEACADYYDRLYRDNGVIKAAVAFFCFSVVRQISPFQAIDEYMAAVHVSGHVDNAEPVSTEMRNAALYDEGPERLHVTIEMVKAQESVRIEPHWFVPFLGADACNYIDENGGVCGLPADDPIHERAACLAARFTHG